MKSEIGRRTLMGAAMAALPLLGAKAQPGGTMRWVVPYAAGGGADVLARLIAQRLGERLGQAIVIDNRAGGATAIGAQNVATAAPDGLTVLTADNGTLVFNTALFKKLAYDPVKDFRPVGLMGRFNLVLCAKPGSPIADAKGFRTAAQEKPGALVYASAGIGSPHHLSMARLAKEAKLELTHAPYRGAAPALNDLVAGTVDVMAVDLAAGGEYVRGRQIKPLAVMSLQRLPELPDVPTVIEALELPKFEAYAWQGMVLPKATPDAATKRLSDALYAVLQDEEMARKIKAIGIEPMPGLPEQFEALLASERAIWVPLIRELGITID
ncbi:tripartite tricarboxylate transporter substrate binding protein [Acetobacteraceae bacterium H6797]|nr:tripartite tricarboxylate transporter substrate binding protein [Acetobacteraceae bacterium H6797]